MAAPRSCPLLAIKQLAVLHAAARDTPLMSLQLVGGFYVPHYACIGTLAWIAWSTPWRVPVVLSLREACATCLQGGNWPVQLHDYV